MSNRKIILKKLNLFMVFIFTIIISIPLIYRHARGEENYWQQFVSYKISVTLNPDKHTLTGEEKILYRNNSPHTLDKIYMHLYPNAFKNSRTRLALEAKKFYYTGGVSPEKNGYIDITDFKIYNADSTQISTDFSYSGPDETILEAALPEPLESGDSIFIYLKFFQKVRPHMSRSGYRGKQHDFAQWYPKMVVYDEKGWHPETYHLYGEFYGEFGNFEVTITVPIDYIIAATGVVIDGDPGWEEVKVDTTVEFNLWLSDFKSRRSRMKSEASESYAKKDSMRTVTFYAANVHDFAWLTSPDFLYESGEWNGIKINVFYNKKVGRRWTRKALRRGVRAIQWLTDKFGPYPYPQISITHGLIGGGMEYPMLVMNSSESEGLILHEVGHIYFYGILGNNETAEAWLDEGFTTFQTGEYMKSRYGPLGFNLKGNPYIKRYQKKYYPFNSRYEQSQLSLLNFTSSGFDEPIGRKSYEFKSGYAYRINAYTKPSLMLEMLEYVVGEDIFWEIMKTYYSRWKLKHVNEDRFREVAEEVSGMDRDWFFDQWLHDTGEVDYALGSVKSGKKDGMFETEVEIKKLGKFIMPVDVEVVTKNDRKFLKRWDGRSSRGTLTFITESKPKSVRIDPENKILDSNLLNNYSGFKKYEIYPALPGLNYTPRDAYLVTFLPSLWYNHLDGVKAGINLKRDYMKRYGVTKFSLWYGAKSKNIDTYFNYSNPLKFVNSRAKLKLSWLRMEGRSEGDLQVQYSYYSPQFIPPYHYFTAGFNYFNLFDPEYPANPWNSIPLWEEGAVSKLYFRYYLSFRGMKWYGDLSAEMETARKFLGSDFQFNYLKGMFIYRRNLKNINLFYRMFGGAVIGGGEIPTQERPGIGGANPRARFSKFYLRSSGSFLGSRSLMEHFHLPGDGNIRGFLEQGLMGAEKLISLNLELRKNISQRSAAKFLRKLKLETTLSYFYDAGNVWLHDESSTSRKKSSFLTSTGFGLIFSKRFINKNWKLRIDFPLWVNEPIPGESKLKFRWIFSFQPAVWY
ncbi:MAG: M1 family aminopeptidase [Fidelibacterota bacterium]